jgi:hypothetical protein
MSPTSHNICFGGSTTHHDLGDKVDDGSGWLLWFKLGEYVALVVCFTGWLPRHKSKATAETKFHFKVHVHLLK